MARSDVFAFERSGLGTFLFAEVGTEQNGSMLTVFSVLARLGQDPWELASQWVKLPKSTITERLTQYIVQMPLPEHALREAGNTAKRLIQLLPSPSVVATGTGTATLDLPRWFPAILAAAVVAIVIGAIVFNQRSPTPTAGAATTQSTSSAQNVPSQ